MKKILSILAVTIVFAGIFVGCGSSNAAYSLPGHPNVMLDMNRDEMIRKLGLKECEDEYGNIDEGNYVIDGEGSITLNNVTLKKDFFCFEGEQFAAMVYLTDDYSSVFEQLEDYFMKLYGKPDEIDEDYFKWIITLPDRQKFKFFLFIDQEDGSNHISTFLVVSQ